MENGEHHKRDDTNEENEEWEMRRCIHLKYGKCECDISSENERWGIVSCSVLAIYQYSREREEKEGDHIRDQFCCCTEPERCQCHEDEESESYDREEPTTIRTHILTKREEVGEEISPQWYDENIEKHEDRTTTRWSYEKWYEVGKDEWKYEKCTRRIDEGSDDSKERIEEEKDQSDTITEIASTSSLWTDDPTTREDSESIDRDTNSEERARFDSVSFFLHPDSESIEGEAEEESDKDLSYISNDCPDEWEKEERTEKEEYSPDLRKRTIRKKYNQPIRFFWLFRKNCMNLG